MRAYGTIRRVWEQSPYRARVGKPGPIVFLMLGGLLAGCTSTIKDATATYRISGNYEDVASCVYRDAEGRHQPGRDVHLTRLTNPPEIRVAVASDSSGRSGILALSWEVEFLPESKTTARLIVRQAGTLIQSGPFWSNYLEPALTRCAGSAPVPT